MLRPYFMDNVGMYAVNCQGWETAALNGRNTLLNDMQMIPWRFDTDVVIYPIADVHLGALEHNAEGWDAVRKEILSQSNAYIILAGDLLNNGVKTSISNVYEETLRPRDAKRLMVEMLAPLRERILCAVSGNHERRNKDVDNDPCFDIMCKLDLEDIYRPNIAFLNIGVGKRQDRDAPNHSYRIAVTHGTGGGVYSGSVINRNERFGNIDGLDCLIVGHTHKGMISRPSKLVIDVANNRVVQRDFLVVSCVSWMEFGGYAVQKMLQPAAHSQPQKLLLRAHDRREATRGALKRIEVIW